MLAVPTRTPDMCSGTGMDELIRLTEAEFREFFREEPEAIVSAPGRLDFLNTHQDYKGLPVVAVGINLRTYVAIKRSRGDVVVVGSGNLRDEKTEYLDEFRASNPLPVAKSRWFGNYIRAAVTTLRERGFSVDGAMLWIRSQVPIGSGLGSSGTLLVSVLGAFDQAFGLGLDTKTLAELAYRAEHDVMGIPCGRLDQYAAAFGNVVYIETRPPYNVEVLKIPKESFFAVADTGIRHSTAEIHPRRQQEIDEGLSMLMKTVPKDIGGLLGHRYWEPRWELLDQEVLSPYLSALEDRYRRRILYTLKAHRSTLLALKAIKGLSVPLEEICKVLEVDAVKAKELQSKGALGIIGSVMTYQHKLLSELYEVSLPQIDAIVDRLTASGALGAKLSGAGMGGAVIALFSDKDMAEKAVKNLAGQGLVARGWVVEVDEGLRSHAW